MRRAWSRLYGVRVDWWEALVLSVSVIGTAALALILILGILTSALADDKFAAPDLAEWYASLMQPDSGQYPRSCCGFADAYEADETAECGAIPNCAVVAIITDTRSDERKLPDGRTLYRPHRELGERIVIPPNKVRHHPEPNPTGHTIVFVGSGGMVYCYEPMPLG